MRKPKGVIVFLSFLPWFFAALMALPFALLRRRKTIKRVLVFPHSKIGDFIAQAPLFREIKKNIPGSFVAVMLANNSLEGLISCNPHVDRIIVWDIKASRINKIRILWELLLGGYDCSFNLSSQAWCDFISVLALIPRRISLKLASWGRGAEVICGIFNCRLITYKKGRYSTDVYLDMLRLLGFTSLDCSRELYLCREDEKFAGELVERKCLKRMRYLVAISPSCGNKLKKMPEEKFAKLADTLMDTKQIQVVFTGLPGDKEVIAKILPMMKNKALDVSGEMSLGQFAAFCKELDLFISVDSGPLYIANALGIPVVDIAGPVFAGEQLLLSGKAKVVQPNLSCLPCSYVIKTAHSCALGTYECMKMTGVQDIVGKVREILPV